MEYNYPKFTPEMKKTHTILIPNMAITQFRLLEYALRYDGYKCEILGNCGSAVAQLGLKYVHNDTCYPALLVIGQFLDALNSGKYDLEHTALLITQTGGGCRASNYIHLLRKALVKAGYPNIPVASLNFSGLEKDSGFQMTLPLARRAIASVFYGDMLCALRNQVAPYENEKAAADKKAAAEKAAAKKAAAAEKAAAAAGVDDLLGDLSSGKNAPKTGGGAKGNNAAPTGSGNTKSNGATGAEINGYAAQIKSAIESRFYDASSYTGKTCTLRIKLAPDGMLLDIKSEGGDPALCTAALAAARQAKMPKPPSQAVYEVFKNAPLDFKP